MTTSMSSSGVYGGMPTMNTTSRSSRLTPNRAHTSSMRGPSRSAIHGTMATMRRNRSDAVTRGFIGIPSRDGRLQPRDEVVAQLRRAHDLGVLEEAEHERAEGPAV